MPTRPEMAPPRGEAVLTAGIGALTMAAPLAIGSVHAPTQVVMSTAALAVFAGYVALRGTRGVRVGPFAGVMIVAVAFTLLQLVPLPAPLVALLSPEAHQLRSDVAPGRWLMPLTVDVPATLLALARGAACLGLFLVLAGFVRSRRHARRFAWILVATATVVALIAAVQRAFGTERILGFYRPRSMPGFGIFGTFVDVNHAASVLTIGLLIAAGLAVELRGRRRGIAIACGAVVGGALLFSTSRGALVGAAVGTLVLTTILFTRAIGPVRGTLAASALMIAVVSTALWTSEGLRAKFTLTQQALSTQKTRGWSDGLRLAAAYRWTGVGRGAFEAPANAYRLKSDGVRLVYPEDLFVQLASEWGIPLTLLLIGLTLRAAWRFRTAIPKLSATAVAAACGVVAVVAHEVTDFGLETLGVALPAVVALGIAVGEARVEERKHRRVDAPARRFSRDGSARIAAGWAILLIGAAWASSHTLDADWAYVTSHPADEGALAAAIARHPADDYLELIAARRALQTGSPVAMRHINRALMLNPSNWQGHRMAARLLAAAQHPAQAALEYRLAIENGFSGDINELAHVLGRSIVDAVPQRPPALFQLARDLYPLKYGPLADAAAARAVEVSETREATLVERLKLVQAWSTPDEAARAARALAAEATETDSFALAARSLARTGRPGEADAVLTAAERAHPLDSSLVLANAQVRFETGDLPGARQLLSRSARMALTLPQRQQAEELLANVAEKQGDTETAVMARARARLISRGLQDMSPRVP